ncbi:MAG TPA: hypothetical protein VD839_16790 [Burkholderiales bacterium]|jgi:hypothetical protein|nr:hypothetical protein [Burkholderiales bacterium]
MWRALTVAVAIAFAGCANIQIALTPQEIADRKMEPVPGKAVIYVVQNLSGEYSAGLRFDDGTQITTWPGTYYRWVTTPGTHTIRSSEGNLSARITLQVEAGKVYSVQHSVTGIRGSTTDASLSRISDRLGQEIMASARLCCPAP